MSNKVFPTVKAEDEEVPELVDPQTQLREKCAETPKCKSLYSIYEECNDRVNSKTSTTETCEQELMDYLKVLDKCVTKDLFSRLK